MLSGLERVMTTDPQPGDTPRRAADASTAPIAGAESEQPAHRAERTAALIVATGAGIAAIGAVITNVLDLIEITVFGLALTIVVALIAALVLPTLVVRKYSDEYGPLDPGEVRLAAWLGAGAIVLAVGIPVAWSYADALSAERTGRAEHRKQHHASAVADLERAATRFEAIGLGGRSKSVKVALAETYLSLGDRSHAEDLVDELEIAALSDMERGVVFIVKAGIAASFGEFEQADRLYQQALGALEPESPEYATALHNQAGLLLDRGAARRDDAVTKLDQAEAIYEDLGDELGRAYVMATRARAETTSVAAQRAILESALEMAGAAGDDQLVAILTEDLALTYQREGDIDEATRLHGEALAAFQALADGAGQATVYANLASLHGRIGDAAVSKQYGAEATAILRTIDLDGNEASPNALAILWGLQAIAFERQGDAESSRQAYETSLGILDLHPHPLTRAEVLVNWATFELAAGNTVEADRLLTEADGLVSRYLADSNSRIEATVAAAKAKVAATRQDPETAARHYETAISVFTEYGDQVAAARQMLALAEIVADPDTFLALVDAAVALAESAGTPPADFEANALVLSYQAVAIDDADRRAVAARLVDLADHPLVPWPLQIEIISMITPDDLVAVERLAPVKARLLELDETDLTPLQQLRVNRQLSRVAAASGDPRDAVAAADRVLELVDATSGFERVDIRIEAGRILAEAGHVDDGIDAMFTGFLDGQTSGMFDFDANDVSTQSYDEAEWSRIIREVVLAHIEEVENVDMLLARSKLIESGSLGLIGESNFGDITWELETLKWYRDHPPD
jgi:tetratricopeptide (TPR) repeat protein